MLHFKVTATTQCAELLATLVIPKKLLQLQGFSSSEILTDWLVKTLNCEKLAAANALENWFDSCYNDLGVVDCDDMILEYDYDDEDEVKYELYRAEHVFSVVEHEDDMPF